MVKLSIQWSNIFSLNQYGSDVADDNFKNHYCDVIMGAMASQITGITIVCSTVYSGADQRKHQNSASLAFMRGIHWSPVNSPHKGPVTRKMFPFDDVIVTFLYKDTWILTECLLNITHGVSFTTSWHLFDCWRDADWATRHYLNDDQHELQRDKELTVYAPLTLWSFQGNRLIY